MVHALDEIYRVIKPDGVLIDLRPVQDQWPVEVSSIREVKVVGYLIDLPLGKADDEAAFRAMREVESRGWFVRERDERFAFFYSWDTPSEMKEFIEEQWGDFIKLEDDVVKTTQSIWATANADAQVRVRRKMLITCWRKSNQGR